MREKEQYHDSKTAGGDIVIQNPFLRWLDNFWYHYKWTVIIVSFFTVTFLVCFVQCNGKQQADSYMAFAGPAVLTDTQSDAISRVTSVVIMKDEENLLDMRAHSYFSESDLRELYTKYYTEEELRTLYPDATDEELETLREETKSFDTAGFNAARQANLDRYQSLSSYIKTGECSLWFISPSVYEELGFKDTLAVPLSDIYGENIPKTAYDAKAIKLSETDVYRCYEVFQNLPKDTLIVLTHPMIMGASSDPKQYARMKDTFCALVDFKQATE